jgi:hypothetical protein
MIAERIRYFEMMEYHSPVFNKIFSGQHNVRGEVLNGRIRDGWNDGSGD